MAWYSTGYRTRREAVEVMFDEIAAGRLTEVDCYVCAYLTVNGDTRYGIMENDGDD